MLSLKKKIMFFYKEYSLYCILSKCKEKLGMKYIKYMLIIYNIFWKIHRLIEILYVIFLPKSDKIIT